MTFSNCPKGVDYWYEYPLFNGGKTYCPVAGGEPEKYRVIYSEIENANGKIIGMRYCGVIYHLGKGFSICNGEGKGS